MEQHTKILESAWKEDYVCSRMIGSLAQFEIKK